MPTWKGESPGGLKPYSKNYRELRHSGAGQKALPRKNTPVHQSVSTENIYME